MQANLLMDIDEELARRARVEAEAKAAMARQNRAGR